MKCHSKWNVTQNGLSLKMEYHSKLNVIQNVISLKMECPSKWNVTQMDVTKNGMSLVCIKVHGAMFIFPSKLAIIYYLSVFKNSM